MKTKVIFRLFPDDSVIALFPALPATPNPWHCSSYMHLGQHGAADPTGVIQRSKPATQFQYKDLAQELRGIGYELQIVKRHTRKDYEARRTQLALP